MKREFGDKIYGNENTNLVLTKKAERAYSVTDPLKIIEHADGAYSLRGCEDRDGMTAEEVNEWLEDLCDACADQWEVWASKSAEDAGEDDLGSFLFQISAHTEQEAREAGRKLLISALQERGFTAKAVNTNPHEVSSTMPNGKEIVWLVDVV